MKRFALVAVLAVTLGVAGAVMSQTKDDPLDPVVVAGDTHKVALENAFVRVLDVHLPPGKVEPRHRHPHGLSVYFNDWDAKVTIDGGQPQRRHRQAGTFAWSDAVIHTVVNEGKTEGHILRIELKF
jgi:quercetin dioxygenase-like cupin family protein